MTEGGALGRIRCARATRPSGDIELRRLRADRPVVVRCALDYGIYERR